MAHVVLAHAIVNLALLELDLVVLHLLESVCTHSEAETVDIAVVELVAPAIHKLPPEVCVVLLAHLRLADARVDFLLGEGAVIILRSETIVDCALLIVDLYWPVRRARHLDCLLLLEGGELALAWLDLI